MEDTPQLPWNFKFPPQNARSLAEDSLPSLDSRIRTVRDGIPSFAYTPLDHNGEQIRLIRVLPRGSPDQPLWCELKTCELTTRLRYKALSYTWRGTNRDPVSDIILNECKFQVLENLYQFLYLRSLRLRDGEDEDEWLWVDQICINQNVLEERNHQVGQMAHIYTYAAETIIWLGSGVHDSDHLKTDWVMHMVAQEWEPMRCPVDWVIDEMALVNKDVKDLRRLPMLALSYLARCEYWKRMWIVQEVWLSKHLSIRYGVHELAWDDLENFFDLCLTYLDRVDMVQRKEKIGKQQRWTYNKLPTSWPDPTETALAEIVQGRRWWRSNFADSHVLSRSEEFTTMPSHRGALWREVLHISRTRLCSDMRDKIFSMLGLVDPCVAITANYFRSPVELFEDIMRAEVRATLPQLTRSAVMTRAGYELAGALGQSLNQKWRCEELVNIISSEQARTLPPIRRVLFEIEQQSAHERKHVRQRYTGEYSKLHFMNDDRNPIWRYRRTVFIKLHQDCLHLFHARVVTANPKTVKRRFNVKSGRGKAHPDNHLPPWHHRSARFIAGLLKKAARSVPGGIPLPVADSSLDMDLDNEEEGTPALEGGEDDKLISIAAQLARFRAMDEESLWWFATKYSRQRRYEKVGAQVEFDFFRARDVAV